MSPYIGYDSDTTFIPGTLNTSSSLYIQGGGITQTGGDVNFDSGTLFIDEDLNRVGIGITNPSQKLSVQGNILADGTSTSHWVASSKAGVTTSYLITDASGSNIQVDGDWPIRFTTNSTEKLRVTGSGNVGIGTTNPQTKLEINGVLRFTGGNIKIGDSNTGSSITSGSSNNFLGVSAGKSNTTGGNNNFLGYYAGFANISGDFNNFFGAYTGGTNNTGSSNNFVGNFAGQANTSGSDNIFIGPSAGSNNQTGSQNIIIGKDQQAPILNGSNQLVIGAGSTAWITGNSSYNIGIGTTNPGARLHVVPTGSPDAAYFVSNTDSASDGTGQSIRFLVGSGGLSSSGTIWSHYSNNASGVKTYRNAIRLYDTGISFEDSTATRLVIDNSGNVGIGVTNPQKPLEVVVSASDYASVGVSPLVPGAWAGIHFGYRESNLLYRKSILAFERVDSAARGNIHILNNNQDGSGSATLSDARLTISSIGNVGIGTTNPAAKLDVDGTVKANILSLSSYAAVGSIVAADPGSSYYGWNNRIGSGLAVVGTTYLDGNVGIGTTNPGYTLDVQGSQNVTAQISLWGRTIGQPQTLVEPGRIYATSAGLGPGNLLLQPTGGNLGIGTDSPSENLHIHAPGNDLAAIVLSGTAVLQTPYQVRQGINGVSNAGFSIYDITATATRLAIDSAGNVGIGVSNPSIKLDVNGSVRAYSATVGSPPYIVLTYDVTPANGAAHGRIAVSNSVQSPYSGKIHLQPQYYDGSAYNYLPNGLVVDATGYVGVGIATPQAGLHVLADGYNSMFSTGFIPAGSTAISIGVYGSSAPGSSGGNIRVYHSHGATVASSMAFEVNGASEAVRISSSGNVGIGTTNPATKLHVRQSADLDGITLTHATRAGIWKIYHSGTASENIAFVQNNGTSDAVSYVAGRDMHNWYTGGTVRMAITSAGSVGVGTDDPVGKLSVSGPSNSRLLNVAEGSTSRFLINGSTASTDAGNAVFYTGAGFDASHYMVLQNNTDAYGRVGLVIRGKTFNGANNPSENDGWAVASPRSGIRFEAYLSGDTGFDSKFAIQHLLTGGTNNSVGDLGILAKGYSTTIPAVILTGSGNVGIGTANPSLKFEVRGGATVAKFSSSGTYVDLQLANSESSQGYIQYNYGNLRFFASSGSTPTLTITGGSPGRVGIGITNPSEGFTSALTAYFSAAEPIYGGFGARSTGGTEDWNHATNARSGGGWSLLLGTNANGPGASTYFHPFSFEYASKDSGGNMTQFAIGYNTTAVYLRYRYNNVWSSWTQL